MEARTRTADGIARQVFAASFAFMAVVALFVGLRALHRVLLAVFAAVLVAVVLNALAAGFARTGTSYRWSIAAVLVLLLLLLAGALLLAGPSLATQIGELREQLPSAIAALRHRLQDWRWGRAFLAQASPNVDEVGSWLGGAAGIGLSVAANAVFVFFVGLFLALEPRMYRQGLLALAPERWRDTASSVLEQLGRRLRWWLLGRSFTMLVIAILTTTGLWLLRVPLALVLGVLAGVLNFVPYVGPLLAGAPAVLLALPEGPQRVLWVAGLFLAIQSLEGYVLTPLVDRRSVSLPPALTLTAQMSLGVLAGGPGVVLASPLLVCVLVVIESVWNASDGSSPP